MPRLVARYPDKETNREVEIVIENISCIQWHTDTDVIFQMTEFFDALEVSKHYDEGAIPEMTDRYSL